MTQPSWLKMMLMHEQMLSDLTGLHKTFCFVTIKLLCTLVSSNYMAVFFFFWLSETNLNWLWMLKWPKSHYYVTTSEQTMWFSPEKKWYFSYYYFLEYFKNWWPKFSADRKSWVVVRKHAGQTLMLHRLMHSANAPETSCVPAPLEPSCWRGGMLHVI